MTEIRSGTALVTVFDRDRHADLWKIGAPKGDAYYVNCPFPIKGEHEVKGLLHLELATPRPGSPILHWPLALAQAVGASFKQHQYQPVTDRAALKRYREEADQVLPQPPPRGLGALYSGQSQQVFDHGVLHLLCGAFGFDQVEALEIFESRYARQPSVEPPSIGPWPQPPVFAAASDLAFAEQQAARKRSEDAAARIAKQQAAVHEATVGELGLDGLVIDFGCALPKQLQDGRGTALLRPTQMGSKQVLLWQPPLGETLPPVELYPGCRVLPRDYVLRGPKGYFQNLGCPDAALFFIRDLREAHGCIDRRPLVEDEMMDDRRFESFSYYAKGVLAPHVVNLLSDVARPWIRTWAVSWLVRGNLVHPEMAARLLREVMCLKEFVPPAPATNIRMNAISNPGGMSWDHSDRQWENIQLPRRLLPEPEAPVRETRGDWIEEKCLHAALGKEYSHHSPGACLPEVQSSVWDRTPVQQDEFEAPLRAAIRGHEADRFSSEDLVRVLKKAGLDCDISRKNDMGRVKAIMAGMSFMKREYTEADGTRGRAYARASS